MRHHDGALGTTLLPLCYAERRAREVRHQAGGYGHEAARRQHFGMLPVERRLWLLKWRVVG